MQFPGFNTYLWDSNSETEFNGTNQTISAFPVNFNTTLGLGHLFLNNPGTKEVSSDMLVRGNLFVSNSAFLLNQSGVNNFQVRGNFENLNSGVINEGKIIIGQ